MNTTYFNSERFKQDLFYVSLGLYITAALLPSAFGTDSAQCCVGLVFLLVGFLSAFLGGDCWLIAAFWLASPFLFAAWYHYRQRPFVAVVCASISLVCWACGIPLLVIPHVNDLWLTYIVGLLSISIILTGAIKQLKTPEP